MRALCWSLAAVLLLFVVVIVIAGIAVFGRIVHYFPTISWSFAQTSMIGRWVQRLRKGNIDRSENSLFSASSVVLYAHSAGRCGRDRSFRSLVLDLCDFAITR